MSAFGRRESRRFVPLARDLPFGAALPRGPSVDVTGEALAQRQCYAWMLNYRTNRPSWS